MIRSLENEAIRRRLIYTDDNILEFWSEIICFHCLGGISKGHNKLEFLPIVRINFPGFFIRFTENNKGNVHLLVINDDFTKLIKLYAIKDCKASTASACLHDYILIYGIPLKILTDEDPSLESKLFQELCNSLGIKKLTTSGYNPRSNGLTKQSNLTTKNYLTAFVTEDKDWDC